MDQELKNNITILALDNLIKSYSIALEDDEITQEDREFIEFTINGALMILDEFGKELNQKPQWDKI